MKLVFFVLIIFVYIICLETAENLVQKKFNSYKKSVSRSTARNGKMKKSLRISAFKSMSKNTTSEFDPILRKPSTLRPYLLSSFAQTRVSLNESNVSPTIRVNSLKSSFIFNSRLVDGVKNSMLNSKILERNLSNQCWSSPCLHGATCFGSPTSYYCYCDVGYTGYNCEININVQNICGDGVCFGNGMCQIDEEQKYSCKCFSTHTGPNCDLPLKTKRNMKKNL